LKYTNELKSDFEDRVPTIPESFVVYYNLPERKKVSYPDGMSNQDTKLYNIAKGRKIIQK